MKTIISSSWITISEDPLLEVEVSAEISFYKDDFDYAGTHCTGGIGGTQKGGVSCEVLDLEYDKSKYTQEQIVIIDTYLNKNSANIKEELSNIKYATN
jgi:hypothetical protein